MARPLKSIPVMTLCLIAATLLLIGTASAVAPDAAFSSNTTSGAAPLTVDFTDNSAGATGWAWFFGDETYNGTWTAVNTSAGWSARGGHTSVVMPNGSIILMGGIDGGSRNDVWLSTDNGATWENITPHDPNDIWSGRYGHAAVAVNDTIVLMGGMNVMGDEYTLKNDVWQSRDYGATWTCVNTSPGWLARYAHTSVAMPDGSIVLMSGTTGSGLKDVWKSPSSGRTWERMTDISDSAEWPGEGPTSVVLPDGSIVIMGGAGSSGRVWKSTDGGAIWTELSNPGEGYSRYSHTSVAMPDGSIVIMGGWYLGLKNDVWRSTDNGTTWTQVTEHAEWSPRLGHTSVAMPDGSIVIMGGDGSTSDVWRLETAGSNARNPSHTYTTPGTYTVTLQAYNDDGYNVTRQVITVTAAVAPTANFTANRTSGTAPLAVQFNDTSTGGPTSWAWDFGDGETSTDQNATHTYAAAGNYTVSLNATNAAGSNTHTETDYITVSAAPVPPVANFTANRTSGTVPLAVQFNDTSTDSPTGWNWSFGDSAWHNTTDAAERNATHTYAAAGTYTVSLTVDNADGTDMLSRAGYITVTEPTPTPTSTPTATPTSRPVYSGGGGGGSTGGPDGYNVGGDSAVSKVNVTGTGLKSFIVTGRTQSSPGTGIPPAPGTPYQYVDLVPARFEEITGATITFSVTAAWLEEHGFTPEEIVMYRYSGTAWEALPTTVERATGTAVTFTATSPGFSLSAISGVEQAEEPATTPTAAQTTAQAAAQPTAEQTTAAPAGKPAPGFSAGTAALAFGAVLALGAGGYLVRRR
ncbi:PKD domain-containing protein [Methanoculleus sp. YWC-01]|uniref:PKD domain-containing protein n=1 Tax=Methanoculleus nereidis TaxID=2735141 RepID=A0ABU3Z146_9EURY|nr:PKD domain-containing protein [Methanoculleus sp. YWC-01]MDV4342537.1 PKD domain-containing protein [Methanoculleus sp. YWC-01]